MSLFSDEIHNLITSINTATDGLKFLGVDILIAKNSPESQAALLSLLDSLHDNPQLYWHIVNGLAAQQAINAVAYYEAALWQDSDDETYGLQETALKHITILDHSLAIRILSGTLSYRIPAQLMMMIVSRLGEQCGVSDFYHMILIMRQHPDSSVRRTVVINIALGFEADVLIPIALGMIHTDSASIESLNTAVLLLWQCITQNKIDGYEVEIILALQYCLYSLPALGVMPYRCLMQIDTPAAKAALAQWDVDSKSAEVQFFR